MRDTLCGHSMWTDTRTLSSYVDSLSRGKSPYESTLYVDSLFLQGLSANVALRADTHQRALRNASAGYICTSHNLGDTREN